MMCRCGRAAAVHFVIYLPETRVWDLCGGCALDVIGDAPAQAWLGLEVTAEAELMLMGAM